MSASVKMSSKHQIVVPKIARETLNLSPGDRLLVSVRPDGVIELEKQPVDLVDRLEGAMSGRQEIRRIWPELLDD